MSESTELPAMTIHRLLGMTAQENLDSDGERELEGKLIIRWRARTRRKANYCG